MKVDKAITLKKGFLRGAQYAAVVIAALNTVPLSEDVGISTQATVAFVIGAIGAVGKAVHNYRKTKDRAPYLGSRSGYALAIAGLSLAASGCITTTAPDGTVTQQVDVDALSTAWARYEEMEIRRAELEAERERAKAERDAAQLEAINREIERLMPEIEQAAEVLGARLR
jgi:hypothetical protein